jgi:hypothetical protein
MTKRKKPVGTNIMRKAKTPSAPNTLSKSSTGIRGLDEITGGGLRAEFSAEEATVTRIFSQDKQREASVALDKAEMGRSRQHDVIKNNGVRTRRNQAEAKQS